MVLTPETGSIGVNLTIRSKQPFQWKDSAFDQLYAQKDAIEAKIGQPLQWTRAKRLEPLPTIGGLVAGVAFKPDINS